MADETFPSREKIERAQLQKLRRLLGVLTPKNAFYAHKFKAAGFTPKIASLEDFSKRAPFTSKPELTADQQMNPPYGSNLTYPLERYTRFHQTSGSSGAPLRWLDTPESWSWMLDNWTRVLRAAGVGPGDRVFCAFSFGPFLGFWTAFEAALRLGCLALPGGGLSSVARLRAMLDNAASVLCCTPTYALRLAEVAAKERIELGGIGIRTLIVAGEPGGSLRATRERIERAWHGARVFDHHGMTETGPVSHACLKRPGVLHVMEDAFYPEVLDPKTERPVPPGGQGELVLTALGREASPLLRYRTGDWVRRASKIPCACGRYDLALEGGILGRTDEMVIVRGVNLYPGAVEQLVRTFEEVAEYGVEVDAAHAMSELRVRIEPHPECRDVKGLLRRIQEAFRDSFNLRVPVTAAAPGALPRFEMKARRWIRKSKT